MRLGVCLGWCGQSLVSGALPEELLGGEELLEHEGHD
jgi:hypothetical protein